MNVQKIGSVNFFIRLILGDIPELDCLDDLEAENSNKPKKKKENSLKNGFIIKCSCPRL